MKKLRGSSKQDEYIEEGNDEADETRREFLKRAGRFAVYTPPAVMVLMTPSRETFAVSGGMTTIAPPQPIEPPQTIAPPTGLTFRIGK